MEKIVIVVRQTITLDYESLQGIEVWYQDDFLPLCDIEDVEERLVSAEIKISYDSIHIDDIPVYRENVEKAVQIGETVVDGDEPLIIYRTEGGAIFGLDSAYVDQLEDEDLVPHPYETGKFVDFD